MTMTGYLKDGSGKRYELPLLTAWKMEYAAGVPCDSFWLQCPWEMGNEAVLEAAVRFEGVDGGKTVFTGVVDECQVTLSEAGRLLEVSGRSMAALLLDNEALPADYMTLTTEDLLRNHVTPYGILVADRGALPAVSGFSVTSGSSEWDVLYDFACYYGGITPYFDRQGRLHLEGWGKGERRWTVDDSVPVTSLSYREKRYGVLSQVLVRDKTRQTVETVTDTAFYQSGGRCRRVITMPGKSHYKAMRFQGEYQIRKAKEERQTVTLTVPWGFAAWPGDRIAIQRSGWGNSGTFRVREAVVSLNGEQGAATQLTLGTLE